MDHISKARVIQYICHLDIDAIKIATQLKHLVGNRISDEDILVFLTSDQAYHSILQEYAGITGVKKRNAPPSSSGENWTNNKELAYYGIILQDVDNTSDICNTRELPREASCFLDRHNNFDPAVVFSHKVTKEIMRQFNDDFQRSVVFIISNPIQDTQASFVHCMMRRYLRDILPESRYFIQMRYVMRLRVNNGNRSATPDLAIILFPDIYVGIVVAEGRPGQQDDGEAQMIAEGIAVAQQDNWPRGTPVFMLRVLGTKISVYKAVFTRDFIQSVETGKRRTTPTIVLRLAPIDILGGIPGYDIAKSCERREATMIICSIALYISSLLQHNM